MGYKPTRIAHWIILAAFWSLALLVEAFVAGCGDSGADSPPESESKTVEKFPIFTEEPLVLGREIFMARCKFCHETGREDAPIAGSKKHWEQRIAQGRETLFQHAIEGFKSPTGGEMPPRGGHDDLTDDEVKSAVAYLIKIVE